MKTINKITGIYTDVDFNVVPQDKGVHLLNGRIYSPDGSNYIVRTHDGNSEAFQLSDGYVPLANRTYNGLCFILSYNVSENKGEIGVYPSPGYYSGSSKDFESVYSPLQNFTGQKRPNETGALEQAFRSERFNFSLLSNIDMRCYLGHDETINISFADWNNPLRVINSGFTIYGEKREDRVYSEFDFDGQINSLIYTDSIMRSRTTIRNGASELKNGSFSIYARYVTKNYDRTEFYLQKSGILLGAGPSDENSNRYIDVEFFDIDEDYTYIEVAYVRKFDNTFEARIINQQYTIEGSTLNVRVDGNNVIQASSGDIIDALITHDVPRTISLHRNRLWAANLKKNDVHNDYMKDYAERFRATYKRISVSENTVSINGTDYKSPEYNDNELEGLYHGGEIYCVGVVFEFLSGRISDPYPITGGDYYDPSSPVDDINVTGIIRFPADNTKTGSETDVALGAPYRLRIDPSTAWSWFNNPNNADAKSWLEKNIKKVRFVRAKRKQVKVAQGFVLPVYNTNFSGTANGKPTWERYNSTSIPILRRHLRYSRPASAPGTVNLSWQCVPFMNLSWGYVYSKGTCPVQQETKKAAIFSIDFAAGIRLNESDYYVQPIFKLKGRPSRDQYNEFANDYYTAQDAYNANTGEVAAASFKQLMNFKEAADNNTIQKVKGKTLADWDPSDYEGMTALMPQGDFLTYEEDRANYDQSSLGVNYQKFPSGETSNLAMGFVSYFAASNNAAGFNAEQHDESGANFNCVGVNVVNIYSQDPTTIDVFNWYVFKNERFYIISDAYSFANLASEKLLYRGDCFFRSHEIKYMGNPDVYDPSDKSDNLVQQEDGTYQPPPGQQPGAKRYLTHGSSLIVTLQSDFLQNKFHDGDPDSLGNKELKYAEYKSRKKQSFAYNDGYSDLLPLGYKIGYNETAPETSNRLQTRVIHSNKTNNTSIRDTNRIFDLSAREDYTFEFGGIVRLAAIGNAMVCVMENAILELIIDQQESVPSETGRLVIGTGDVINERYGIIASEIGSQHFNAIYSNGDFIIGVDVQKRTIWIIEPGKGYEPISDTKNNKKILKDFFDVIQKSNDRSYRFPDSPTGDEGFTIGYDHEYEDIFITFTGKVPTTIEFVGDAFFAPGSIPSDATVKTFKFEDDGFASVLEGKDSYSFEDNSVTWNWLSVTKTWYDEAGNAYANFWTTDEVELNPGDKVNATEQVIAKTLFYNKAIKEFCGQTSFNSRQFVSLNDTFYSSDPKNPNKFYLHNDSKVPKHNYYGIQYPFEMSIVVNEYSDVEKLFSNIYIKSAPNEFQYALFQTLEQISGQDPFVPTDEVEKLWRSPKYFKEQWSLPLNRTETLLNIDFDRITAKLKSKLKGSWMKVTLVSNSGKPNFVKMIETNFTVNKT